MLSFLMDPVSVEQFADEYWEHKPLLLKRRDPDYYRSVFTIDDADELIQFLEPDSPFLRVVNARDAGNDAPAAACGRGIERVFSRFRSGSSIVLQSIHRRSPRLAELCRSLSHRLSQTFQVNAYLTPSGAQALPRHWDTHDVFVLQIDGGKEWRLWNAPLPHPLPHNLYRDDAPAEEPAQSFLLEPGDCLYIPRGWVHEAVSRDEEPSFHLTVGAIATTWHDLMVRVLQNAAERHPELRKSLPIGYATRGADALRRGLREQAAALARLMLDDECIDGAVDKIVEEFVQGQTPSLHHHVLDLMRVNGIGADTAVGLRENLAYRKTESDQYIVLEFHGKRVKIPLLAKGALARLCAVPRLRVGDIFTDLDDASAFVLVRRLVREGFLTIEA
jgi:ribosomal protein L16 Arg81 hydroxylase